MSVTMGIVYLVSLPVGIIVLWILAMWGLPRIRLLHNARLKAGAVALTSVFLVIMDLGSRDPNSPMARVFDFLVPDFLTPFVLIIFVAAMIIAVMPPKKTFGPKATAEEDNVSRLS